jgi:tRNA threonylcarbamoyl adenosine modification protein YjeE
MMTIFSDISRCFPDMGESGYHVPEARAIKHFRAPAAQAKSGVMAQINEIFRRHIALPDLDATARLGGNIAGGLRAGDAVALWGDLGAGKTTLARAILRALGVTEDVPSPTFTLVQSYDTRLPVAHYDLYRLKNAREMEELGFDDALADGAVLVEWPERAPEVLPPDALHVRLGVQSGTRSARLTGPARWESLMHD